MSREYYSVRTGKHPTGGRLDLEGLRELFLAAYLQLEREGYFAQTFGFECVDAGFIRGTAGHDAQAFVYRRLKKRNVWPIKERVSSYTEDDIFDMIELLHDCVSMGVEGQYHSYNDCGWHYDQFDVEMGRVEFRDLMNDVLRDYGEGHQITDEGEVVSVAPQGLGTLQSAQLTTADPIAVKARVDGAIAKYRRRGATVDERRDAVRDLADVLEYLRPKARAVLKKSDEADLFTLANNFGIRHHNVSQKLEYDHAVWMSWMFYYYLATIHALTRLIEKHDE